MGMWLIGTRVCRLAAQQHPMGRAATLAGDHEIATAAANRRPAL
jgi:hypothetical protein